MPIEIRELVIKAEITENGGGSTEASSQLSENGRNASNKDSIVAECVEKVLEILTQKIER